MKPATPEELAVFEASLHSFPDFNIEIDGFKWHVHSRVISSQSRFFEKACNSPFKESTERNITLHDDSPWIVARMIKYLYTGESTIDPLQLRDMLNQNTTHPSHATLKSEDERRTIWQTKALLYCIADKYEIPRLMTETRAGLAASVQNTPSLLTELVEFMDVETVQRDRDLTEDLLSAAMHHTGNPLVIYNDIRALFGHDGDIMEAAHAIMAEEFERRTQKLSKTQEYAKDLFTYIDQAHSALTKDDVKPALGSSPLVFGVAGGSGGRGVDAVSGGSGYRFARETHGAGFGHTGVNAHGAMPMHGVQSTGGLFGTSTGTHGAFSVGSYAPESGLDVAKRLLTTARSKRAEILGSA